MSQRGDEEPPETLGLGFSSPTGVVGDILRECWAYHEEQERNRTHASDDNGIWGIPPEESIASQSSASELLQTRVNAARERARAVLQGFQPTPLHNDKGDNFKELRQKGFQREAERKQQALLRNWAYLLDRQTRRAEQLEAVRARKTAPAPSRTTMAVYWSTAPPDVALEESDVRQLFCLYGAIHKIVQYRNKETGILKGDGLVIYQVDKLHQLESRDLIHLVCGQVSAFTYS
jgi:hypothetical protein